MIETLQRSPVLACTGCTGKGQPCDVDAQRSMKAEMKKAFDKWAVQSVQAGSNTLDTCLSVMKPGFPALILAGQLQLLNNPDIMQKAWQQCGLAEPWNLAFQIEARNLHNSNQLFPRQLPADQEAEPDSTRDLVDTDSNPIAVATKQHRQGHPQDSKPTSRTAQQAVAAADGNVAQPRKRDRPLGSKNMPKPGQASVALVKAKGRGRGRGRRPHWQMARLHSDGEGSAHSQDSTSDSSNASLDSSRSHSEPDPDSCISLSSNSNTEDPDDSEGEDDSSAEDSSIADEEIDMLEPEVDDGPSYDTDEEL